MLTRRHFSTILGFASFAAAAGPALARPASRDSILLPKKLSEGDTVGLVLPASMEFESDRIDLAREQLEAIGFRVKLGRHVFDKVGYFAGHDRDRAADVNAMFADDSVDGIVCYTGGWGTPRILPHLDYETIRRNPKVLLGYSDITALLNAVHQRTGLVTFHGPVAASNLRQWSLENLRRMIMSTDPAGLLESPPKDSGELVNRDFRTVTIRPGRATGPAVGGNLTLVAALMGTPWQIESEGAILFLEDVHEDLYRVDRMLTQLAQGGLLRKAAGIVFGYCSNCPVKGPSFSLGEILEQHFGPLGIPVMSGFAFGHISKMHTVPVGLPVTLDAGAGRVEVDRPAVR